MELKFISTLLVLFTLKISYAQHPPHVISPYHSQNIRNLYMDSLNHHSSFKTILYKDSSYSPPDPTMPRKSWLYRKLFTEHLLEFRKPDFNVFADFLPDFQIGASNVGNPHRNNSKTLWLNTRGARVQANVGEKFYFETSFFENQGAFPYYLDTFARKQRIIPGQGEIKSYNSWKAFDFAYVNALLSYTPSKYLNFTLGYGNNNFIGDGYRSMLLSDVPFSYPYLKITGTLGQFQYTAMWAQFEDLKSQSFNQAYYGLGYEKKWGVFHYLDWNVSKRLSIGLFEAIIWPDADSSGRKRGFDWTYMNPLIFLRPAEFSVGSSDNALLGLTSKFKLSPRNLIYGQFMIDEFKIKELLSSDGWWGNKWSAQLGLRSFDLFRIPHLDLIGEFNIARPYTYSYSDTRTNYAHYNQSLAHPMGANFREALAIASYAYKRWYIRGQITYANYGLDYDQISYGQDIFKPYTDRKGEYDNRISQGLKTDFLYGQGTIAFVLNPKNNLRLELSAASRREKNELETKSEFIFSLGLRSTFRQLYYDF